MNDVFFGGAGPWVAIFVTLFAIVLAIAWIIMPFAIIGTKPILRELLQEQRRTNDLLAALGRQQAKPADPLVADKADRYPSLR